jgi:hypothetical protein
MQVEVAARYEQGHRDVVWGTCRSLHICSNQSVASRLNKKFPAVNGRLVGNKNNRDQKQRVENAGTQRGMTVHTIAASETKVEPFVDAMENASSHRKRPPFLFCQRAFMAHCRPIWPLLYINKKGASETKMANLVQLCMSRTYFPGIHRPTTWASIYKTGQMGKGAPKPLNPCFCLLACIAWQQGGPKRTGVMYPYLLSTGYYPTRTFLCLQLKRSPM